MSTAFDIIPVDRVTPHDLNVRRDLGDLDELAASIKGQGLLQPLIVAPHEDGHTYVLIAGHRRHAAAIKAGVESLPCIVRDDLDSPAKVLSAMLVENLQRTDLTVMEEADAYAQLELLGVKEAAIVKTTGRSKATVHQRILLAGLPAERREQFEKGQLSLDGAVKCAKLRQQWADDTEILAVIDKAHTWSFASAIDYDIQRALDARNAPEPVEDDEDTIDYAGQRAEREAEWEKQRKERDARNEALSAMSARMYGWISGRLVTRDPGIVNHLVGWAIEEVREQWDTDAALPLLGIEPCGEDEDVDDANQRILRSLLELPADDRIAFLALALCGVTDTRPYSWEAYAEHFRDMGYAMTADDFAAVDAHKAATL